MFSSNIAFRTEFSFHIALENIFVLFFLSFWLLKTNAVGKMYTSQIDFHVIIVKWAKVRGYLKENYDFHCRTRNIINWNRQFSAIVPNKHITDVEMCGI